MRKIPFAGIELTSQRVRGLRGTSELPGRPADRTENFKIFQQDFVPIKTGLIIRILILKGALGRPYSSRMYFRKLRLDGQVGVAVDVPFPTWYTKNSFVLFHT